MSIFGVGMQPVLSPTFSDLLVQRLGRVAVLFCVTLDRERLCFTFPAGETVSQTGARRSASCISLKIPQDC